MNKTKLIFIASNTRLIRILSTLSTKLSEIKSSLIFRYFVYPSCRNKVSAYAFSPNEQGLPKYGKYSVSPEPMIIKTEDEGNNKKLNRYCPAEYEVQ